MKKKKKKIIKKFNKKRALKLWKLCRRWCRARASLHQIPIMEDDNKTPAKKYAGTNSLYMKKCRLCLELEGKIVQLMFGYPDTETLSYLLGYDEKYKTKKKNR